MKVGPCLETLTNPFKEEPSEPIKAKLLSNCQLTLYSPDLALVRFSPPITPSSTVNTACLPTIEVFEGMQGEIIGYGRTIGNTSSLANFIKEVQMKMQG